MGSCKECAAKDAEIAKLNKYIDVLTNSPCPSEVYEIEVETGRRLK